MSNRDWKSGQSEGQNVDRGDNVQRTPRRRSPAPGRLPPSTHRPAGESGPARQSVMAASEQSSARSSASRLREASESASGGNRGSASARKPEVSEASRSTATHDWKGARPKTTRNPVKSTRERKLSGKPGGRLGIVRTRGNVDQPSEMSYLESSSESQRSFDTSRELEPEMMHDRGRPLRMTRDRGRMVPPAPAALGIVRIRGNVDRSSEMSYLESPSSGSRSSSETSEELEPEMMHDRRKPLRMTRDRGRMGPPAPAVLESPPAGIARDGGRSNPRSVASSEFESMFRSVEISDESRSFDAPSWGSGRSRAVRHVMESVRRNEGTRWYDRPLQITGDRSSVVPSSKAESTLGSQVGAGPELLSTRRPLVFDASRLFGSSSASSESMHPKTGLAAFQAQGSRSDVSHGFDRSSDHGDDNQTLIIHFSGPSCLNWESEYYAQINQSLTMMDDVRGIEVTCCFILMLPENFSEIVDRLRQAFKREEYVGIDHILFICRLIAEAVSPTRMTFRIEIPTLEMKFFAKKFAYVLALHYSCDLSELSFLKWFPTDLQWLTLANPGILKQEVSDLGNRDFNLAGFLSIVTYHLAKINAGRNVFNYVAILDLILKENHDEVAWGFERLGFQTSNNELFNRVKEVLAALQRFLNECKIDPQPNAEKMRELKLAALAYIRGEVHHQESTLEDLRSNRAALVRPEHLQRARIISIIIYRWAFPFPPSPIIEVDYADEFLPLFEEEF